MDTNRGRVAFWRLATKCNSSKRRGVLKGDITIRPGEIDLYSRLGISKEPEGRRDSGVCSEYG